ncbi:hypothetical protein C8J57DRAFT_1232090 [Mycena rebaudengoi]|nr:hypothetical protein C8J57DRAFT_1232090 [Mycena rebaudengoi]
MAHVSVATTDAGAGWRCDHDRRHPRPGRPYHWHPGSRTTTYGKSALAARRLGPSKSASPARTRGRGWRCDHDDEGPRGDDLRGVGGEVVNSARVVGLEGADASAESWCGEVGRRRGGRMGVRAASTVIDVDYGARRRSTHISRAPWARDLRAGDRAPSARRGEKRREARRQCRVCELEERAVPDPDGVLALPRCPVHTSWARTTRKTGARIVCTRCADARMWSLCVTSAARGALKWGRRCREELVPSDIGFAVWRGACGGLSSLWFQQLRARTERTHRSYAGDGASPQNRARASCLAGLRERGEGGGHGLAYTMRPDSKSQRVRRGRGGVEEVDVVHVGNDDSVVTECTMEYGMVLMPSYNSSILLGDRGNLKSQIPERPVFSPQDKMKAAGREGRVRRFLMCPISSGDQVIGGEIGSAQKKTGKEGAGFQIYRERPKLSNQAIS